MEQPRPIAVVTGGASGIGAATVATLARNGFRIACLDRNGMAAERVARSAGAEHMAITVDVADEAAMIAAFQTVMAKLGRVDALATCAGILDTTPFMDVTVASFRRIHDVNVIGTFLAIREAARHMTPGGRICTVASVAGLRGGGLAGTAAYAASKGAVLALTRNAARALVEKGIAVNTVAPGPVLTPMLAEPFRDTVRRERVEGMVPLGRSGAPQEIAESIAWLLSSGASYVNGATLAVDGGLTMH